MRLRPRFTGRRVTPARGAFVLFAAAALLVSACAGEAPDLPGDDPDAGFVDTVPPLPDAGVEPDAEAPTADEPTTYLVLWTTPLRDAPEKDAEQRRDVRRGSTVARVEGAAKQNGYLKVAYQARKGWMPSKRLAPVPLDASPLEVARANPDAFFKRQVYHPVWNPTGPSRSGNCAPTSLAMAAMIFDREPPGMTVEQSIDRVRRLMHKPSDSGGASIAQVREAADALKLQWKATARGELDAALGRGRAVVLTGAPGSAYRRAFSDAGYAYTYDGPHSILVIARMPSGKYLVADPLSKVGTLQIGKAVMKDFYASWGGAGTAVWRN